MDNRLLTVTDQDGNTEGLTNYKDFKISGKVNGQRLLSLFLMPDDSNKHSWPLAKEESLLEYNGQKYRIKKPTERSRGNKTVKMIQAHHILFDLIDQYQYDTLDEGSISISAALSHTLTGTGYTYEIIDTFGSATFKNFGNKNRLELLQTIMNRYKAEFDVNNTHIIIKEKIGNTTDFQFRFKHNIKTIQKDIDTSNVTTYIKGYGADGLEVEYTSPNANLFPANTPDGFRHAEPVVDDRYTTEAGLLARLQEEVNDEPYFSVTLTFAELKKAGYPFEVVELGDETHLIYEPMDDLMLNVRVMEYNEFPEQPSDSTVTLGNYKKSLVKSQADLQATRNQIERSFVEGRLRSSAMELAVQRASEALNNALTELEFPEGYGIIARNPSNANHFLALNSNGLGITLDGGVTFKEAVTTDGFVLSAGVVGTMLFNYLRGGELILGGDNNVNGVMQVKDSNGEIIFDLDGNRGGAKQLFVEKLTSQDITAPNVARYGIGTLTFYLDPNGDDNDVGDTGSRALLTFAEALRRVPEHFDGDVLIRGSSNTFIFNEDIDVSGKHGKGKITINLWNGKVNGRFETHNCTKDVELILGDIESFSGINFVVLNSGTKYLKITDLTINGNDQVNGILTINNGYTEIYNNVEIYNVENCIRTFETGARVYVENVEGLGSLYGLRAERGGVIRGTGLAPSGGTANTFAQNSSDIIGAFTFSSGTTTAPAPEVTEVTEVFNPTSTGNWRPNYSGQWNANNNNPYQGKWDEWGLYYGLWFFGDDIWTKVNGKTVKRIRVRPRRLSGTGNSAAINVVFRTHNYDSRPSGEPTVSSFSQGADFKWGDEYWVTLVSNFRDAFANGTARGIAVYTTDTGNLTGYGHFDTEFEVEITYE